MTQPDRKAADANPVAAYKQLLKEALDRRPSGMRQRLAKAIGKNRSFVSQISNPAYPTPIPAEHVDRILEVCHFAPEERAAFMKALPGGASAPGAAGGAACRHADDQPRSADLRRSGEEQGLRQGRRGDGRPHGAPYDGHNRRSGKLNFTQSRETK